MAPSLEEFIAFSALWISILVMCGYYGYYCSTWRNTFEQKLKKEGYCSWSFLNVCWKFLNVLNKPTLTSLDWWSDILTLKTFLIVLVAGLTSATYTVVYVTLSSLFVALITFHFRSREFGQHEASVFIRELCISGINAYLLRPGLEANVFLFTNIFKILESVVFIVVIHLRLYLTYLHQNILIPISVSYILIVVSYIAIYCADIYDHDKYRNARDEDLNSLFESKHFELIMKLIRKNKFKLKDLSLDQLIYLRENGAPLSMFECSDIEVYNLYAVGYDFSEYNTEDLESTKGFSKTALIWASQKGHSSMIRNLIDAGVNLEAKDETGSTALICASENGHDSTVQILIDAGADVKAKTDDGSTALFCARTNGHESIMKMLIDAEADVKESAKDGNTFLIGVSESGGAEIDDVKAESDDRNLMGAGADSDANNKCMHMSTYVDFPRQRCSTDQEPSHENSLENPVNLNLTPELEAEWKASNSGGDDLDLQPEPTMESIYIGNSKPVVAPKPHKDPARVDLPMHNSPILEPIPPMEPSTYCSSIGEAAKAQDRYGNNSA